MSDLILSPLRKFLQSSAGLNSVWLTGHQKKRGLHFFNDHYNDAQQLQRLKDRCLAVIEEKTKNQKVDLSDSKSRHIDHQEAQAFYNED